MQNRAYKYLISKLFQPRLKIAVISAWMPKSSVQGRQNLAYYIAQNESLIHNRQVTVHGLDTGIPAGMTMFLARQDLCITMSAGAWERSN